MCRTFKIQAISRCPEASAPNSYESSEVTSYSLLLWLHNEARELGTLGLITEKIKTPTPKPLFVPIASSHDPPPRTLEAEVNVGMDGSAEYSPCMRCLDVSREVGRCHCS